MNEEPRTRECTTCRGQRGKTESGVETRDGQQIATQTWRQCTACSGTGRVPV